MVGDVDVAQLLSGAADRLIRLAFDRPGVAALAAVALWLVWLTGAVTAYFVFSPSTAERLLRARGPRRWARVVRSFWLRRAAALLSWPHVLIAARQRRASLPAEAAYEEVARSGGAVVRRYHRATPPTAPPVLLVHALVSHPWILDLAPGRSLVRHLLDRGHDVWMVTWGTPSTGEPVDLVAAANALATVDAEVRRITGRYVHLVGYCTGGMLALLRLAAAEDTAWVGSLTLIATPVDLRVAGGIFSIVRHPELRPAWVLDGRGRVPAPIVREAFHLQNRNAWRSARLRRRLDGEDAALFDALDRWLFRQRDLEGELFFDLVDLARANSLVTGEPFVGVRVDTSRVRQPVLVALADRDTIVPAGSSLAARHVLPDTTLLDVPAGHVGMLASEVSPTALYDPVSRWIVEVDDRLTQPG